ncbi:MAG TPA: hypothetical protein ENG42_00110 [Candidatus Aenigmarchaeota archaeon]|nr:MAG: hypothetical protein DRP03_00455 [Candidatus Aenigmarchaeota archaeon]HDD45854.1 hypothetical protein [Candidatus Aenigmarchaeota archaeon]
MKIGKDIVEDLLERRKNVVDILKEMKALALVSIYTAFAALLTEDKELAKRVIKMSNELDVLQYQLEIEAMLAASNPRGAINLTGILRVGSGIEDISNSVKELVDPVLRDIPVEKSIVDAFRELGIIKILDTRKIRDIVGKKVKEIEQMGARVIGIKFKGEWLYPIDLDEKIREGCIVVVSGNKNALSKFQA